jgi:TonB family protein
MIDVMTSRRSLPPSGLAILALLVSAILFGCSETPQQFASPPPQQSVQINKEPRHLPAKYPDQALKNSWEGTVVLRIVVGGDGRPSSVELAESSGHGVLDDAAKECAGKWTFRPEEKGTNLVRMAFTLGTNTK